jgi:hypothetical protein
MGGGGKWRKNMIKIMLTSLTILALLYLAGCLLAMWGLAALAGVLG